MLGSELSIQLEFLYKISWVAFYTVCALLAAFTIVGSIAFWKAKKDSVLTFSLLFERGQVLKLSAVILIIISVVLLGIIGKIESTGIVGILSGIAGYVLGGLNKSDRKQFSNPNEKTLAPKIIEDSSVNQNIAKPSPN